MEDLFAQPEHAKNIYVIRQRLGELKPAPGYSFYQFSVGKFGLKIFTPEFLDIPIHPILANETVDAYLYETIREVETYISLYVDPRFKDYQPIIYSSIQSINIGSGKQMPISHLCELIQYLYRLSNLTAFW